MAALAFTRPDALRAHLDARNEAGKDSVVVGIDDLSRPFLAQLIGPYAESISVLFGDPKDAETHRADARPCDECGADFLFRNEYQLTYPIVVMER